MNAQGYIQEKIEQLRISPSQKIFNSQGELVDFIYSSVMSKKFRKYAVGLEYQQHIRSAIEMSVKENKPINFAFVFGGYKLWRLEEAPEADWAELFSIIYYASWVKPIAENYKPGVWFDFYSDDVIVPLIDNIPKEDIERYQQTFQGLLDFIKSCIPKNINFTLNRVGAQYSFYDDFKKELDEKFEQVEIKSLSDEQMATLKLNVKPKSQESPDWLQIQRLHDAYMQVSKRRPYYRTPDKIMVITKQLDNTIALGTTKTSVAKFWAGVGALKKKGDSFIEYVLSPKQVKQNQSEWLPIVINGLDGKNFKKIRII